MYDGINMYDEMYYKIYMPSIGNVLFKKQTCISTFMK